MAEVFAIAFVVLLSVAFGYFLGVTRDRNE